MEARKRTTSIRQLELLIDFMEKHKDLAALGRVRSLEARALAGRLWEECAGALNAEGVFRTPKEWSRFWNDYKCRVRGKLSSIRREYQGTGGGPSEVRPLSALEDRVASLIGRDAGPLAGVRRDPLIVEAEVHYEEVQEEMPEDSPTLDLSNIQIVAMPNTRSQVDLDIITEDNTDIPQAVNRTITDNPEIINAQPQPPPENNTVPQPVNANRNRRPVRPRARARPSNRNNTTALDEARASIVRMEEMRTRMEEMRTRMELLQAEAMIRHEESIAAAVQAITGIAPAITGIAQAITGIAEAMQTIAETVQLWPR